MIPIRTVCQIIDVDFANQDGWLKKHPIYAQLYTPRTTVGADNKERPMNCLSFFDTFGWLNSITQKGRKPGTAPGYFIPYSPSPRSSSSIPATNGAYPLFSILTIPPPYLR